MGFFDAVRENRERKKQEKLAREVRSIVTNFYGGNYKYFAWNYAGQIYKIPEVRSAIEKIADIFSTMPIYHRRTEKDGYTTYLNDSTARVLNYKANPAQNSAQFIKEAITRLLLDNNVFIEPIYDPINGNLKSMYVIPTKNFNFEIAPDLSSSYVQFLDGKGNLDKKYNLNNIIHVSRFCSLTGRTKNELGLYETVLKSLAEQIVNVAKPDKPRAILQSNQMGQGLLKDKDKKGAVETVRADFAENVQGIAYLDKMWNITPISWNENDVNKELMRFVVNIVYNYFGMNDNIMNNKATEIEMSMFVNSTIKPLAMQFEKEFTNKLFTENEFYFGHRIEFDYQPLLITTISAKTNLAQAGLRNGFFNIDEVREQFGYSPLPDGTGRVYRTSADLVNVKVVDSYQLGKVGQTQVSTPNEQNSVGEDIKSNKEVGNGEV